MFPAAGITSRHVDWGGSGFFRMTTTGSILWSCWGLVPRYGVVLHAYVLMDNACSRRLSGW